MFNNVEITETYDIESLEFEYVPNDLGSYYQADLKVIDGDVELCAIYDFDYRDDSVKASLAVGNPQSGKYASSDSTKDWPVLDNAFGGRKNWKKFLEDKAEEEALTLED